MTRLWRYIVWGFGGLVALGLLYRLLVPLLVPAHVGSMVGVGYINNGVECVSTPSSTCFFVFFARDRELLAQVNLPQGARKVFEADKLPVSHCVSSEPILEPSTCKRRSIYGSTID